MTPAATFAALLTLAAHPAVGLPLLAALLGAFVGSLYAISHYGDIP